MKKAAWLMLPAMLGLWVTLAVPQTTVHHFPTPPESLDPQAPDKSSDTLSKRLDLVQLQRDADDPACTAQTIPTDVASVRKGMLPKT